MFARSTPRPLCAQTYKAADRGLRGGSAGHGGSQNVRFFRSFVTIRCLQRTTREAYAKIKPITFDATDIILGLIARCFEGFIAR